METNPAIPPELRPLYPFAPNHLDVGGANLHYVDEGTGPPIVLLHGNPTWSFYFRELIAGLSDRYRVIAPDHIGCGLSDKPANYSYRLKTHIDNVEKLIDHLGLTDVTLGVHDWGGAIGMGWAVRHAAIVRRLIVFNTAAFFGPMPFRIRMCRWPIFGDLAVRGLNGFLRASFTMATARPGGLPPAVKRGYLLPYDSWAHRIAIKRFVEDIPTHPGHPSHAVLTEIDQGLTRLVDRPMMVFWGGRDFCFNDTFLDGWRQRFPGAIVHRFEDASHYCVEDAHERILPLLDRFLSNEG